MAGRFSGAPEFSAVAAALGALATGSLDSAACGSGFACGAASGWLGFRLPIHRRRRLGRPAENIWNKVVDFGESPD